MTSTSSWNWDWDWDYPTFFRTKATYGSGTVMSTGDSENSQLRELAHKWPPLTRKLDIPASMYRRFIVFHIVAVGLFLAWKITHKNEDAIWLWGISLVCELWFAFSWLLNHLPKLFPINHVANLTVLKEKFETITTDNPTGKSDLPGIDVFVSAADSEKEPPLIIANTILSILAVDYPIDKLCCYFSDDGGDILTFEAMAEAATFAKLWIPFCRKHSIECRNPEKYFNSKENPYKNQSHTDFVNDRRRVKRQFHDFEIRINGLSELIRQRSDIYHEVEESKVTELQREVAGSDLVELIPIAKATWMSNGIHWPGTWKDPSSPEHTYGHHAGMVQVMLKPPNDEPLFGNYEEATSLDFTGIDIRLPMLVYISREKHSEYEHNKKAGALNALLRASGVMSNGPFILDLDCNQYIYNSQSLRKGICFMMDRDGDQLCYVQFPQSFDPSDCHVSNNSVFLNVNMRALDGLQGPVYVGTGCLFRRIALYGFDPSRSREHHAGCFSCCFPQKRKSQTAVASEETHTLHLGDYKDDEATSTFFQKFGNSSFLINSIPVAELKGRPLADNPAVKYGRQPGILTAPRELLDSSVVAEALRVVSSWYEDKTEWGYGVGWIYGSLTQNIVTGYRMHNQGWKSVYCVTDAFRRTAPMNLTDQLHQMLQQATDSVEIFFSSNNALFASSKMKILQRVAYLNVTIYPFTSIFFVVYCFLPALSLFTEQFIVQALHGTFLMYLLIITLIVSMLSILETKWSDITLEEWWRNKQFWLIGGTSAHLTALLKGFLKIIAGSELACTSTLFSFISALFSSTFAAPYNRNWTPLLILPITIVMVNLIVIAVGIGQAIYRVMPIPQRSKLLGSVFFSFWVLAHLYPVAKGLMGQRRRIPMIVFLWCGILSIGIWLLLWVAINPPSDSFNFP